MRNCYLSLCVGGDWSAGWIEEEEEEEEEEKEKNTKICPFIP